MAKNLALFAQTIASFSKILISTLVYKKNDDFFAENWRKPPKIVIIASTPGTYYFKALRKTVLIETYASLLINAETDA
jgi:hypothetical protein